MLYRLKRHPFPVVAHFDHCLVLTYALPAAVLETLLPPGLQVDRCGADGELGFLAIAAVATKALRPAGLPSWLGRDFFLSGYRVFARFRTPQGRTLRGLRILRSDTDRPLMVAAGNLLTHYRYRPARANLWLESERLELRIATPNREADLSLVADLADRSAALPDGSPFGSLREALRFAGPLPYTFDYEPETGTIVVIKATRKNWKPRPVCVEVREASFFEHLPFRDLQPVLAGAFYVHDIAYRWERGVRYAIEEARS